VGRADRDAAFAEVTREIRKAVEELASNKQSTRDSAVSVAEPRTWIVDQRGDGDYVRIADALATANAGDRIVVRAGRYQDHLVIDKRVEITGDLVSGEAIIEAESARAPTVLSRADGVKIERLTLRQQFDCDADCVEIAGGNLELAACEISSRGRSGVAIAGDSTARLHGNTIHDNRRVGVLIMHQSKGLLEENEIANNEHVGVVITAGPRPTLRRNSIQRNAENGIFVSEDGVGTIEENDISDSGSAGVLIHRRADPQLKQNRIHGNRQCGVALNGARGLLETNLVYDNAGGGLTIFGGAPLLHGNNIDNNRALACASSIRTRPS